jgi:type I restriction enzyme S subunit
MADVSKLVTEHIDVWTNAIKKRNSQGRGSSKKTELTGIKKLRELILELAVRGKLVPQDTADEPASILLDKIAVKKEQLIADKKIKKQKLLSEISNKEMLVELPSGWSLTRLDDICFGITSGSTPPKDKFNETSGVPYLKVYNIKNQKIDFDYRPQFVELQHHKAKLTRSILYPGDVVMNIVGPPLGKIAIIPDDYPEWNCNQAIVFFRPIDKNLNSYIYTYLTSGRFLDSIELIGTAGQDNISVTKSRSILFSMPPLAEQHRIVAKVDELMLLCDDLEQQTEDSISAHQTLVEVLLATLTNPTQTISDTADCFQQNWQRIAEHFDVLFTTEHSIEQLKQTILQLAVMGKLVPQNPKDEPASVLLEKIAEVKEQLIADKKIKKQKTLPVITDSEHPFQLPLGWEWSRLPDIGELARGKSKHRPRNDPSLYLNGDIKLVQTGDVARSNGQVETYTAMYNKAGLAQSRLWPKGTMCITIAANIADTGILSFDACFPDSVVGFIPFEEQMSIRYFEYFVRTAKSNLEAFAPATAQKNINLEILGQLLVPLPPLNELNAIVSKIDDLMALCGQLKERLSEVQITQLQLADTIVEQAVN